MRDESRLLRQELERLRQDVQAPDRDRDRDQKMNRIRTDIEE